ncbi:erythromycin esterase family protein [Sphingobacterium faecale]|uniref:Erythromycin esterase family protein n=1 Tax=Sphingobacterium faecale TaxID=2803775 RepID=A0ABS1R469_9SPHI|nr:erythromycin esterase family protein [Sphingobacterium faecale]MBL1409029.1 erythromycin esterase family protein [Sphingobacterium faecale]
MRIGFKITSVIILFCLCNVCGLAQRSLNLDFELKNYATSLPKRWYAGGEGFKVYMDSIEKYSGKWSLAMEKFGDTNGKFGVYTGRLPIEVLVGKNIEYKGWIKTNDVKNGYAGLWLRIDGENGAMLALDNMSNRGLKGNNNWTPVSIKMNVGQEAKNIDFGGLFTGEGSVWFDHLELYIDGHKFIDIIEPEPKTFIRLDELAKLQKYIYPLRTYEPDGGDTKDLKVLDRLVGNSKVVALGEVTHGSSEIFKMKNRIVQYLARNKDFDIFSIEANMPESYKLNDYIVKGEGDPRKLIAGMYFWTWNTEEVLNMVEWMHKFNQPKQRITFTGFDMQFYEGALKEISEAFQQNEGIASEVDDLKVELDKIRNASRQNKGMVMMGDTVKQKINSIITSLQHGINVSSFKTPEKIWLQKNIDIVQQYLGLNSYSWRDKCMADNVLWIKNQNPESKIAIWAHNGHIQKTDQKQGEHLAKQLGDDYVTFGFTFFDGSFTATGKKGLTSYDAVEAYPGTLEYLLDQVKEPVFILDLKKIKLDNNKETEWLLEQLEYRRTGAMGGNTIEFSESKISEDFDYLIFIKSSSPSKLLTEISW